MRYQIAVCGSAVEESPEVAEAASAIGQAVAQAGHILVSGGTTGYPWLAAKAAQANQGLSLAISPAANRAEHTQHYRLPLDGFDLFVWTGQGFEGRNVTLVRSADAVIVVGGRIGTVQEFTIAHSSHRLIGILAGSSKNADLLPQLAANANRLGGQVIVNSDPLALIDQVLTQLDQKFAQTEN